MVDTQTGERQKRLGTGAVSDNQRAASVAIHVTILSRRMLDD
jgi:hypothetical protein